MTASLEKIVPADSDPSKAMVTKPLASDGKEDSTTTDEAESVNDEVPAEEVGDSKEESDETPDAPADETDPDFKAAVTKHLPTLDDLPKEARPIVAKRLKDMEAGYTRAMQEAREYRKEKATLDSEKEYRTSNPDQWLADFIEQHPTVIDRVNEELAKRADPTYAQAHAKTRAADAKEAALNAERQEMEERRQVEHEAHIAVRTEYVTNYTEASAKRNGIPLELVEEAIAAAIMASDDKDITDAEIERIVAAKAKVVNRLTGAAKGAKTKEYAKGKAQDARQAATPPKSGSPLTDTPAPKKPANLEEAINAALDRLEEKAA
ncbi:MAG: hypothetical protein ABIO63_12145 [Casimicrobiaceae bacterium]